jgi:hypothetical protein
MFIGVIGQGTMGEQHRLGLLYSAFGNMLGFYLIFHQPNYRLQYISIIVVAPLQLCSQKPLKYYGETFIHLNPQLTPMRMLMIHNEINGLH